DAEAGGPQAGWRILVEGGEPHVDAHASVGDVLHGRRGDEWRARRRLRTGHASGLRRVSSFRAAAVRARFSLAMRRAARAAPRSSMPSGAAARAIPAARSASAIAAVPLLTRRRPLPWPPRSPPTRARAPGAHLQ